MKKRVVVTGMGAITPIGNSVDAFWEGIKQEKIGFDKISYFDASDYKCKIAAQVKDFDPAAYMDKKAARRMEQFCQFAIAASKEALEDAGIDMEKEDAFRIGCSIGNGVGSLQAMEREHTKLMEKGPSKLSPLFVPLVISNMAAGNVSIAFGLKGKNINVVTACATGTNSIGEAFRAIQYGDADIMLSGGTESSITPLGIGGFSALTALSTSEDPARCSIPFDKDRDGFVMGEGAGILILEELEHAKARGAEIYAEIIGYGASADAHHVTAPIEDGSGDAKAIEFAIRDAGIKPEDIDYINAHGTSTHMNDAFETKAIKLAMGDAAYKCKVNSTKSMVGHLLGAAGGVEAITCVKSINENYVHANVGLVNQDPECDLDCPKEGIETEVNVALSNSLGFGGHNAVLIFKRFEN